MMTTRIVVGLTAGTCLIFSQNLMAEVSVFNPALLEIDHQSGVDIRQFNRANLMPPGVYSVDIFINGKMFERQDVTFVQDNRRSRVEGTLTQSLGRDYGNLYLTLSRQQYWHTDDVERLMQFGYSSSWKRLSWNVSWSYSNTARQGTGNNHASDNTSEQIYMLSLSVPLSGWWGNSYATYSVSQNDNSGSSHQLGLSGTALERNNLSWNLMQSYNSHDDEVGGNMSLTYDGSYGTVNGSYNYSQNSQRLNYGIRGGILAHSEGVTLSQELGETIALVKAPGAAGLEIDNMRGAATDWRGYTVKTQLNPYDENRVAISDNYFSKSNIELDNTVVTMVPTRGAVVKAEFVTHVGYRVLFRVLNANGKLVPFGAIAAIQDASLADSGIVGDRG